MPIILCSFFSPLLLQRTFLGNANLKMKTNKNRKREMAKIVSLLCVWHQLPCCLDIFHETDVTIERNLTHQMYFTKIFSHFLPDIRFKNVFFYANSIDIKNLHNFLDEHNARCSNQYNTKEKDDVQVIRGFFCTTLERPLLWNNIHWPSIGRTNKNSLVKLRWTNFEFLFDCIGFYIWFATVQFLIQFFCLQ